MPLVGSLPLFEEKGLDPASRPRAVDVEEGIVLPREVAAKVRG
jgi:hypothetical protein